MSTWENWEIILLKLCTAKIWFLANCTIQLCLFSTDLWLLWNRIEMTNSASLGLSMNCIYMTLSSSREFQEQSLQKKWANCSRFTSSVPWECLRIIWRRNKKVSVTESDHLACELNIFLNLSSRILHPSPWILKNCTPHLPPRCQCPKF
jgi:hypothetical protein